MKHFTKWSYLFSILNKLGKQENVSLPSKVIKGEFSVENGKLDFTTTVHNVTFAEMLEAITLVRDECQRQIDNQSKCPYYKTYKK